MNRKDEILDEIVSLEKGIEDKQFEWKIKQVEAKKLTEQKGALETAYKELCRKLDEVTNDLGQHESTIHRLVRSGKADKLKVEELKRELSRMADTERINKAYQEQIEAFKEACLNSSWREENRSDGLGAFEYQIDGAIHLAVAKQALLGDKRGLGKSLTSLVWCDLIEAKRVIAVCPSDTMNNFVREIMLWTPHRSPILIGKLPRGERDFLLKHLQNVPQFMIVLNYEAWRKDGKIIDDLRALNAETVILDESHLIKDTKSIAYEGVHDIVFANNQCTECGACRIVDTKKNGIYRCRCGHETHKKNFSTIKYVLPMTGTPILNRPQELFSQIHIVNPVDFPDEKTYLRDFCQVGANNHWTWRYGGQKAVVEKIGPRMLIRDRNDVGMELPPVTREEHLITQEEFKEFYPKQYEAYEQARKYAQIVLDPDNQVAMSMPARITVMLRLRQVLVWPAAIELRWQEVIDGPEHVARLNVYESAKIDRAEKVIRQLLDEGERITLFSQFKPGLQELKKRLGSTACIYDGSTSDYMRNQIQLDFDVKTCPANPRWNVVLANYKSGGVGLNFNAASQEILLDPEWNPGKDDQAVGRIDRIGQKNKMGVHDIRVERSIDTWMADLLEEKMSIVYGFEEQADVYKKAYDALRKGEM